jgi:hypothetical protein
VKQPLCRPNEERRSLQVRSGRVIVTSTHREDTLSHLGTVVICNQANGTINLELANSSFVDARDEDGSVTLPRFSAPNLCPLRSPHSAAYSPPATQLVMGTGRDVPGTRPVPSRAHHYTQLKPDPRSRETSCVFGFSHHTSCGRANGVKRTAWKLH